MSEISGCSSDVRTEAIIVCECNEKTQMRVELQFGPKHDTVQKSGPRGSMGSVTL